MVLRCVQASGQITSLVGQNSCQGVANVCNYCKENGKVECPAIQAKSKRNRDVHAKPTMLAMSTVPGSLLSCGPVDVKAGSQTKVSDTLYV